MLEVDHDEAAVVASRLVASLPVKDISISEPKLEAIIESIYLFTAVPDNRAHLSL